MSALLVLAAVIMLTAMTNSTMQPLPASAPAREFSAGRALTHLEKIAAAPRPLGSAAGDRARDYLVGRLRAAGLHVEVQRAVGVNPAAGLASFGLVENIVATLPGTNPTGTVLVAAHYDSAAMGPGASDDGAAVAAMVETARAVLAGGRLRNDLVLLMSDGEEDGVLGAEAFAREHPLGRKGGVLLNWEARGVSGPSLMFETSRDNARLVELFARTVPHPRGDSTMAELYRLLPNNTDFTPLTRAGFTGMNFAYLEGSSYYHSADDSLAHLDRGSLQHHGTNMLTLVRALGAADLPTLTSDDDVTYFRIFGVMVTYPGWLVRPLAMLSLLAVAGLALLARRRELLTFPRLLAGAVTAVVPLLGSVVLAQALWQVLVAIRPAYDAMGGLLHRPEAFEAAIAVLSGLALLAWYLPLRRRLGPAAPAAGALVWPAGLGLLCAQVAPGAAFMFTLPALLCALGGLVALMVRGSAWGQVAAITVGSVMAAALLPYLARNVFDGMGLALGGAGALVLAIFGLTVLPVVELLLPEVRRKAEAPGGRPEGASRKVGVVAVALVAAGAPVGAGLLLDGVDAGHPRRTHLAYVMDADTRAAHWVSADADPDAWTRRYVSGHDVGGLPPGYARGTLWAGTAPAVEADGPRVSVLSRRGDTVEFHVTAGRGARSVTLRVDRPITGASASVAGVGAASVPVTGTRVATWPAEVRFRGIPARGVRVTLRVPGAGRIRLTAISETDGLSRVPGFVPMPPGLVAGTREDGGLVAVTRTYPL